MLEHNPPPLGNGASPPVIPLPVALYVSDELILSSMTGGTALPQISDPLGEARSSEGKRALGNT